MRAGWMRRVFHHADAGDGREGLRRGDPVDRSFLALHGVEGELRAHFPLVVELAARELRDLLRHDARLVIGRAHQMLLLCGELHVVKVVPGFRDRLADFQADGATIWGLSILDSESKARFKAKHALTYPLLADEDHAVAEAYGVWREKSMYGKAYMGVARATFLIDPEGRVAHTWDPVKPEGHAAEVHAALTELRGRA